MLKNIKVSKIRLFSKSTNYQGNYIKGLSNIILTKLLWILSFASLSIIFYQTLNKHFNHDEFEAVHSAWKIQHGEKIYIDFFQQQHPLLYYLLVPILGTLLVSLSDGEGCD